MGLNLVQQHNCYCEVILYFVMKYFIVISSKPFNILEKVCDILEKIEKI